MIFRKRKRCFLSVESETFLRADSCVLAGTDSSHGVCRLITLLHVCTKHVYGLLSQGRVPVVVRKRKRCFLSVESVTFLRADSCVLAGTDSSHGVCPSITLLHVCTKHVLRVNHSHHEDGNDCCSQAVRLPVCSALEIHSFPRTRRFKGAGSRLLRRS